MANKFNGLFSTPKEETPTTDAIIKAQPETPKTDFTRPTGKFTGTFNDYDIPGTVPQQDPGFFVSLWEGTKDLADKAGTAIGNIPTLGGGNVKQSFQDNIVEPLGKAREIAGDIFGSTGILGNVAYAPEIDETAPSGTNIEKLKKNYEESLIGRINHKSKIISGRLYSGITGGIIPPGKEASQGLADDFVGGFSQAVGTVMGIRAISSVVGGLLQGSTTIGGLLDKYPTVAKYVYPFVQNAIAFDIYGQLNPDLKNRLEALYKDTLVSVPYTALGFIKQPLIGISAATGLGFGLTKLDGGSNQEAVMNGIILGMLDGIGRLGGTNYAFIEGRRADVVMRNAAAETLNKYAGTNIKPNASAEELKKAYYDAARATHPDREGGSTQAFQAVNSAYRFLTGQETVFGTPKPETETPAEKEVKQLAARDAQKAQVEKTSSVLDVVSLGQPVEIPVSYRVTGVGAVDNGVRTPDINVAQDLATRTGGAIQASAETLNKPFVADNQLAALETLARLGSKEASAIVAEFKTQLENTTVASSDEVVAKVDEVIKNELTKRGFDSVVYPSTRQFKIFTPKGIPAKAVNVKPPTPAPKPKVEPVVVGRPAKDQTFIYNRETKKFEKVDGKTVDIVEGIDTFIFKRGSDYRVTEGRSGLLVGQGGTRKEAIAKAKEAILKDLAQTKQLIEDRVNALGLSPRYKGSQKEQVKEAVSKEPKSIKEVSSETGILEPNVRRILGVGAKEGTFERVDEGVYVLKTDGKEIAYIQTGDALKVLPALVKKGMKADMIFLDIPYSTAGVTGGNRGIDFNVISAKQFKEIIVPAVKAIARTEDSPIVYMYSNSKSGWKQMVEYNNGIITSGLQIVGKGTYSKTYKSGEPMKFGKYLMPPEGILIFNKSGKNVTTLPEAFDIKAVAPLYKGHYQTEKAPALLEAIIRGTTKVGDTVLDPFAGSGVAPAEAVKAGRKAIAVEKDPQAVEKFIKPRVEKAEREVKVEDGTLTKEKQSKGAEDYVKDRNPGVDISLSETNESITLNRMVVPPGSRNTGLGTGVMNDLVKYADQNNKRILLTPSTDFGATSISRLEDFYKRFGFIKNRGKARDFSTREAMVREVSSKQQKTRKPRKASRPTINNRTLTEKEAKDLNLPTETPGGIPIQYVNGQPKIDNERFMKKTRDAETITNKETEAIIRQYFSAEELPIEFVEKIVTPDGGEAWGKYHKKMITFVNNPETSAPNHETVHAFLDLFTPTSKREGYLNRVLVEQRKALGNDTVDREIASIKKGYRGTISDKRAAYAYAEEVISDGFVEYVKTGKSKSFLRSFFDRIISFLRRVFDPNNAKNLYEDIVNRKRENKKAIEKVKEAYYKEINDKYAVTTKTLNRMANDLKSPTVGRATIEQYIKRADVSKLDADLITETLKGYPEGKIDVAEFINSARANIMPLSLIESGTYKDHGISNIKRSFLAEGGKELPGEWITGTNIWDTPYRHGQAGHFSGDYSDRKIDYEIQQRTNPETNKPVFFATEKGVTITQENLNEVVGTMTDTREEAQAWIDSVKDKPGIKPGLFGHSRYLATLTKDLALKQLSDELIRRKKSLAELVVSQKQNQEIVDTFKVGRNIKKLEQAIKDVRTSEGGDKSSSFFTTLVLKSPEEIRSQNGYNNSVAAAEWLTKVFPEFTDFDMEVLADVVQDISGSENGEGKLDVELFKNKLVKRQELAKDKEIVQQRKSVIAETQKALEDAKVAEYQDGIYIMNEGQLDPFQSRYRVYSEYTKAVRDAKHAKELPALIEGGRLGKMFESNEVQPVVNAFNELAPTNLAIELVVSRSRIEVRVGENGGFISLSDLSEANFNKLKDLVPGIIERADKKVKELEPKRTPLEKQFFDVGNKGHERLIKETIRLAAQKGYKTFRLVTPLTNAIVESSFSHRDYVVRNGRFEKRDSDVTREINVEESRAIAKISKPVSPISESEYDVVVPVDAAIEIFGELDTGDYITVDGQIYEVTDIDKAGNQMILQENSDITELPYEWTGSDDPEVGDTINYEGTDHQVLNVDGDNMSVAKSDRVRTFMMSDYITDEANNAVSEAQYEIKSLEKTYGEIDTANKAKEVYDKEQDKFDFYETELILRDMAENAGTPEGDDIISSDSDKFTQRAYESAQEMASERYSDVSEFENMGYEKVFFRESGYDTEVIAVEEGGSVVELPTPSNSYVAVPKYNASEEEIQGLQQKAIENAGTDTVEYEKKLLEYNKEVDKVKEEYAKKRQLALTGGDTGGKNPDGTYKFDIKNLSSDEGRTVYNYYEKKLAPFFLKYRADAKLITEPNTGLQYYETKLTPEDAGTLEVYKRKEEEIDPLDGIKATLTEWKDKAAISLSRETMDRNIEAVAGENAKYVKQYFNDPVKENETNRAIFITQTRADLQKKIVEDLGIKAKSKDDKLVQRFGEKTITLEELKKETTNWQNVKEASEIFRKTYDNLLDMVNIQRTAFGYDPIPKREDYFRHFQEIGSVINQFGVLLNADSLPTEIAGITGIFKPGKPFSNAELRRVGTETTESAILGMDNYLDSITRQIFHIDSVQRGRTLEKTIRNMASADTNITLPNFVANLTEAVNLIAGKKAGFDRAFEGIFGRPFYGIMRWITRRTAANMIAGNISSAITNFIPLTQSLATTSNTANLRGLGEAMTTSIRGTHINGVRSSFLTRRFPEQFIDIGGLVKGVDKLNILFKAVDQFVSRLVVGSKYYEGLERGLTSEAAMKRADEYGARIMADRSIGQLPNLFGTRTLGVFTQFQTEINNQFSFVFKDVPKEYKGRPGTMTWTMFKIFLYGYLFNELFQKLTGRRPAIDPIYAGMTLAGMTPEGRDKPVNKKIFEAGGQLLGNLPFTGGFSGGRFPISAGLPDVPGLIQGTKDPVSEILKPVFFLVPPGGGLQFKKSTEGVISYLKGGSFTQNDNLRFPIEDTAWNFFKASVFGQYANDKAREYFGQEHTPLSDKQTEAYNRIRNSGDVKGAIEYYDTIMEKRAKEKKAKEDRELKKANAK